MVRERYRGTLLGVAVGDALGAPIEFMRWDEIRARYGPGGVRGYVPGPYGRAAITDDTQMTLATARGLLRAASLLASGYLEGVARFIYGAYLEWLATQDDPGQRRAPGLTCLAALRSGKMGTVERPLNDSKGCGGVMRVAPVGLALPGQPDAAFALGVCTAAITHGHAGGYLPAGSLAALLSRLVAAQDLHEAVAAEAHRRELDAETRHLLRRAMDLAQGDLPPAHAIAALGEGWTGDEALAIGVFCALRYAGSPAKGDCFRQGVLASVNHSGDSDSTGAVAGGILGAWLGEGAIPPDWLTDLESRTPLVMVADEIYGAFGALTR